MKIAVFTDTFDEVNGVANTFTKLVEYAVMNNKEVEIFTQSLTTTSVEKLSKKVKVHRVKTKVPWNLKNDLSFDVAWFDKYLLEYFKSNSFDLIHSATPGNMGLHALFLSRMFHIPLVGSYHTQLPESVVSKVEQFLKKVKWLEKRASQNMEQLTWNYLKVYYGQCSLLITHSASSKEELSKKFEKPVQVLFRGVDTQQFNPRFKTKYFKKWYGVKTAALFVGNLSADKNLDFLIEVFKGLPEVKLFVVGDGDLRKELEGKIDAEFIGHKKGNALSKMYANCDFFVYPSWNVSGGVLLEAMASGLPVVITSKSGAQELVKDGINGFIVNPSIKEFSEKVKILTYSERIRKKMSDKAKEFAKTRDWNTLFVELFKVYEETRAHSLVVMKEIP